MATEGNRRCACGAHKEAGHPICPRCYRDELASEGRLCACGGTKNAEYIKCKSCAESA
ncbi:MAG: hypothetical protein Q8Q08_12930 [Candidatus Omnitrophota bacterium]|nr:hypothetical protein [Candidatus Omnitrophota bacterium]